MKRVLLLGGSYSDIPLIKEAKRRGMYVITSGNNPKDLGHQYSDEQHFVDFSNKEKALELAKKLSIDYIIPSAHDLSMVTSSYISEQMGLHTLDSYNATLLLHHKDKFKKFVNENNLMSSKSVSFSDLNQALSYQCNLKFPVIVKPIDMGGGKGITKVCDNKDLAEAIQYAFTVSIAKKIIIEEFVEGTLHSCSTFIKNSKVVFIYCDNEHSSNNPYGVSTSTSPMKDKNLVEKRLREQTEKLVSLLHLQDGLLHMQFLYDKKSDNLNIIEYTRRMPGDWYYLPLEKSTGFSYVTNVFNGYVNEEITTDLKEQKGYFSRHCLLSEKEGMLNDIYLDNEIKENIIDSFIWGKCGDIISDITYQKFGLYFLEYNTYEEMMKKTDLLHQLIKLEIE
jgi:carbamoylphosphate synthase large subunit